MSAAALPQAPSAQTDREPVTAVFDIDVAAPALDLAATLRTIAAKYGKTYQRLLLDLAKASFGPGRLSYEEYVGLRLFDDTWLKGADPSEFVGLEAERRIWMTANSNSEWWGLMRNKLAVTTLLGGYGFPVIPTLALYSDALCMRNAPVFRDVDALGAFLRACREYPLFGKPADSRRSLGSIGLDAYEVETDSLVCAPDRMVPVGSFVAAVARHYRGGYIFQRRIAPHDDVRAIAGDRLATVRVITILSDAGPEVLRALWKIPAGANVADNFWRPGNLLATLDLTCGRVVRVVRGSGLGLEEVTHHPDTEAELLGIEVPNWREIFRLALDAASALREVRLIGWDIAAVESGALIVEPNFTPDFLMAQLADRRGMLDARFNTFLAQCKAGVRQTKWKLRTGQVGQTRESLRRLRRDVAGA
ncbi:MAG: sugar-transfer associated ATP-grasp domain-containing protein [Hyphomicrobiaceae bacterium]